MAARRLQQLFFVVKFYNKQAVVYITVQVHLCRPSTYFSKFAVKVSACTYVWGNVLCFRCVISHIMTSTILECQSRATTHFAHATLFSVFFQMGNELHWSYYLGRNTSLSASLPFWTVQHNVTTSTLIIELIGAWDFQSGWDPPEMPHERVDGTLFLPWIQGALILKK